jgi:hypothetical protein
MARPIIRIKRSTTPGSKPSLGQLQLGELALNTNDAELYVRRERIGFSPDIARIGAGATVTNVLYVTKDGNDNNTGKKLGDAKATIKGAVAAAKEGTVIKVSAGVYVEDNPIALPEQTSIVGDNLREVSVQCANSGDLFWVSNGNYVTEMSFIGPSNPGGAIFAFNPEIVGYFDQSPYIQNCTNFVPDTIGLKIDGLNAVGPLKSMVLDSYTQYNPNGVGASMTNEGYSQLVSLFTICNDTAVFCGSGAACDLTNSNSSFGNYALIADGVGPNKFTGTIVEASSSVNEDTFVVDISTPSYNVTNAIYDHTTGILTAYTNTPHQFEIGSSIKISGLGFTCSSDGGVTELQYPSGNYGYVFEPFIVAPGRYYDAYNLIQSNRQEIIDAAYAEILVQYPSFTDPDQEKCKRDIGYFIDYVSEDVRDLKVKSTVNALKFYFNDDGTLDESIENQISETVTAFQTAGEYMKLAINNQLTNTNFDVIADPNTNSNNNVNSCSNVKSYIDNIVGIVTTSLIEEDLSVATVSFASTVFSAHVGPAPFKHYYTSGGTVELNIVRPFDGQVVYFDELYYEIKNVVIGSGGTGYTQPPVLTFESPEVPWGITGQAVAEINSSGVVDTIELVSSGRGYRIPPKVTVSAPQSGINTAVVFVELTPVYYSITRATSVSPAGITTITISENLPYIVGVGTQVPFFKQSRVLASGHSLEYIGTGPNINNALPKNGGVPIPEQETDSRNGGLVVFTSTDQAGNFKIGDGIVINQNAGTISGDIYSKSLFATLTPFILALGGD